jgi:2-oxoglutarate ferredoxin oxidoreductase subunit delta
MPKKAEAITINENWCKSCEFCVQFCPADVLEMKGVVPIVVNFDACTACGLCEVLCPDFAIVVTVAEESAKK